MNDIFELKIFQYRKNKKVSTVQLVFEVLIVDKVVNNPDSRFITKVTQPVTQKSK